MYQNVNNHKSNLIDNIEMKKIRYSTFDISIWELTNHLCCWFWECIRNVNQCLIYGKEEICGDDIPNINEKVSRVEIQNKQCRK